ncbi:MAG: ATP-binding protein [Lachnospiraceae bacterium]|nr:ATP-binding protein [Lachnospiraceae bacterium]
MRELELKAVVDNLDEVLNFVDDDLEANKCGMKAQMQIDLCLEEIFVNICNYAYGSEEGNATIATEFDNELRNYTIVFKDSGMPFNPLDKEDPDTTLSAEERKIGGLGIFLVKKNMDEVAYEYKDKYNIFTIMKKI